MLKHIFDKTKTKQNIIFFIIALLGCCVNSLATFPGYLYSDSKLILEEIQNNSYNDWHSPFYIFIFHIFTKILPGPELITLFNISGMWIGCLAISLVMRERLGWKAGLFLVVPIMPGMLNLTGTVVIDTTMNVFFLASIIFLLLSVKTDQINLSKIFAFFSIIFLIITYLVRNNALFAIIPLLYLSTTLLVRTTAFRSACLPIFAAALCGLLLAAPIVKYINKPASWHPIMSLQIKHLQQLSYYEQKNLFPGQWNIEQEHRILRSCYKFENWDNDAGWGHCGFIFTQMNQNDSVRHALTRAWLQNISLRPLDFFVSLLPTYQIALFHPMRPTMMFNWFMPELKISWHDQEPHHQKLHNLHKDYVESQFNLGMGKPFMGILLSCLGLVVCFVTRSRLDQYDRVFCALMASGIIYLLTFLPINVATEYRYYIWGLLSAEVGTVYCVASLSRSLRFNFSKTAFPPFIKGLVAASTALVLTTKLFSYPQEVRTFSITPQGDAPARILYLREEIDKFWTDAFEGHVDAPGWNLSNNEYVSGKNSQPLTMTLSLPYQDAALGYASGPDYGSFRVCEGAGKTCQTVDAHSATAGEQTLILPGGTPPLGPVFTVKWVSLFFGLSLALYLVLLPGLLRAGRALVRSQHPQAS